MIGRNPGRFVGRMFPLQEIITKTPCRFLVADCLVTNTLGAYIKLLYLPAVMASSHCIAPILEDDTRERIFAPSWQMQRIPITLPKRLG